MWRPGVVRVLVVDECPDFRELARCILECEGFEVFEARDALAGLQRAVEESPDLILLDLGLSGLDGAEVCRRLRDDGATNTTPIVIWSSSADAIERKLALEAGASAHVVRSLRPFDLAERARECLTMPSLEWIRPRVRVHSSTSLS